VVVAALTTTDDFQASAFHTPEPYASIGAWRN
jgi:hypothetical protein